MKIIGLTGKSGSGKGAVASILSEMGMPHIDCDKVYHSLISGKSPCTEELRNYFGSGIMLEDGSVDRKRLGALVFSGNDKEKNLDELNRITHKHVLMKCRELIASFKETGASAVIMDAPTLFESGFYKECDIILVVTAEDDIRLERIMKRDSISKEDGMKRLAAQKADSFYTDRADFVISNNGDLEELKKNTEKFIREKLI